jgi:shikimate kinase/3-dehydroquinate synthase
MARGALPSPQALAVIWSFQYTDEGNDDRKLSRSIANLIITGFSGTGKSVVAKDAAERLRWGFVDTDDEIVRQAGKPIADIFREDGESAFRKLERDAIEKACRQIRTVIAIGGGAIVDLRNYELLAAAGLVICLEAKAETIYERLFREAACNPGTEVRPLLAVDNPRERIRELKASRQPYYARADWTIHTDALSVNEVAKEVVRAWRLLRARPYSSIDPGRGLSPLPSAKKKTGPLRKMDEDVACLVETATERYPVYVGYGLIDQLGDEMLQAGLSGTAVIVSDGNVFPLYGERVRRALMSAGLGVNSFIVEPGEETKSMDSALRIYDFLVGHRIERDDVVVALGGGVVGDLAGFVAATFLRGIRWVQVPTSLIAMADSAIGGKVGVNHAQGKNLIGSFHQPTLVLADCQTLATLPERELTSGWAEVVKYGLILDEDFFGFLEANVAKLRKLQRGSLIRAIALSVSIKAGIVSRDEKERTGLRTVLNYGHTIGHALEAATRYKHFLHGEAIAIGMMGAARLSQRLGLLSLEAVERQQALLHVFGLPTSLPGDLKFSPAGITGAMELDKKAKGRAIRWVLLQEIGKATVCSDVPQRDVSAVLREMAQS